MRHSCISRALKAGGAAKAAATTAGTSRWQ